MGCRGTTLETLEKPFRNPLKNSTVIPLGPFKAHGKTWANVRFKMQTNSYSPLRHQRPAPTPATLTRGSKDSLSMVAPWQGSTRLRLPRLHLAWRCWVQGIYSLPSITHAVPSPIPHLEDRGRQRRTGQTKDLRSSVKVSGKLCFGLAVRESHSSDLEADSLGAEVGPVFPEPQNPTHGGTA